MVWTVSAVISGWYGKVPRRSRTAFVSALAAGLIAHISIIANTLFNHDYLLHEPYGMLASQGKWFSDISYQLDAGYYSTPLIVITSIVALALSAAMLADLLQLRSRIWSAAIGAALAVFPSAMASLSFYMNFWDIFLAVLSLWLIWRIPGWPGWLGGVVALTLSLGIYQAYIGFTAAGLLMYCAQEVLRPAGTLKSIWARALRSLSALLAAIGAYYAVVQTLVHTGALTLIDYKGINQTLNHFDWKRLPQCMAEGYAQVFDMLLEDEFGSQAYHIRWLYRAVLLLLVAGLLLVVWDRGLLQRPARLVMLALFVGLYPMAVHLVYPLSLGVPTSWMTRYPFVMLFVALFKLADMAMQMQLAGGGRCPPQQWPAVAQQWLCFVVAVALCYIWTVMDHEGYLRMKFAFYGAYAMENKIAQDIYSCPDYTPDSEVALIGLSGQETEDEFFKQYDAYNIMDKNFIFSYGEQTRWFLEMWLQPDFHYADQATLESLQASDAFAAMPVYPQPGYVQSLDGVIVAKFAE